MSKIEPPEAPTVDRRRLDLSAVGCAAFRLEVTEGPDAGRILALDEAQPSRSLVGTSPSCDLRLSDPHVSRRHLALEVVGRRLRVEDLGSTNGTFADGIAIGHAFLRGGEIVRLGVTALRVEAAVGGPAALPPVSRFGRVLGASPAMRRLYPLCERLARADVPVIIEGETGTGKEQLAEAMHEQSPRARAPFVVLDCTALAPSLVESELFGHERGAFTGSVALRRGVFERADGGTLLIDEIGDLALELQPKLLRAIERATVTRVGGDTPVRVNVRVLAATRRDLDKEVQNGRFRDDLFHRLAVTRIELPPLRERAGDVSMLARYFWAELGGSPEDLTGDVLRRWEDWRWPGNVRELRNAVARRFALADLADAPAAPVEVRGDPPYPPARPEGAAGPPPAAAAPHAGDAIARILALQLPLAEARDRVLREFEQRYLEQILEAHGGNVTRAAAAAGIARRHFHRLRAKG